MSWPPLVGERRGKPRRQPRVGIETVEVKRDVERLDVQRQKDRRGGNDTCGHPPCNTPGTAETDDFTGVEKPDETGDSPLEFQGTEQRGVEHEPWQNAKWVVVEAPRQQAHGTPEDAVPSQGEREGNHRKHRIQETVPIDRHAPHQVLGQPADREQAEKQQNGAKIIEVTAMVIVAARPGIGQGASHDRVGGEHGRKMAANALTAAGGLDHAAGNLALLHDHRKAERRPEQQRRSEPQGPPPWNEPKAHGQHHGEDEKTRANDEELGKPGVVQEPEADRRSGGPRPPDRPPAQPLREEGEQRDEHRQRVERVPASPHDHDGARKHERAAEDRRDRG